MITGILPKTLRRPDYQRGRKREGGKTFTGNNHRRDTGSRERPIPSDQEKTEREAGGACLLSSGWRSGQELRAKLREVRKEERSVRCRKLQAAMNKWVWKNEATRRKSPLRSKVVAMKSSMDVTNGEHLTSIYLSVKLGVVVISAAFGCAAHPVPARFYSPQYFLVSLSSWGREGCRARRLPDYLPSFF